MESRKAPAHRDEPADEYSDIASVHSETETKPRRKHQRGGRKASYEEPTPEEMAGLMDPEDEQEKGTFEENHEDEEEDEEEDTCKYCSRKSKPTEARPKPKRRIPEPFETGIRAFNVRKAAGGARPIGIRTTSEKKKPRSQPARPAATKRATSKSDDARYESQSEASSSKTGAEEEESEEHDQAAGGKPMSIRLDLDLMIEVFLKAKIKGAVTVTFLE